MPKSALSHTNSQDDTPSSPRKVSETTDSADTEFYPEYVDAFDERYNYWMRAEHLARYLWARDFLTPHQTVLDFACANGYGTKILSSGAQSVVGIDRNPTYLDIARKQYSASNISYQQLDVNLHPIQGKYDIIVCFETIEHVKYPEQLLQNFHQILNPGGLLLLSVPNSAYEKIENDHNKDPYHLHIFQHNELLKMFHSAGFKIAQSFGQSYTNKMVNNLAPEVKKTDILTDASKLAYPDTTDIPLSYSYIFVLKLNRS